LIIYKYIFVIANEYFNSNLLKICFNDLLAPGGTIAMDNALFGGKPYLSDTPPNEGVTRFNDMERNCVMRICRRSVNIEGGRVV
jgi:predicted O-methyltransferase YrrM